jgi:hypothetical protein
VLSFFICILFFNFMLLLLVVIANWRIILIPLLVSRDVCSRLGL